MTLPANVGKGTVRGKFIDSSGAPIEGVVTFKPTPKRLANATATPRPVTILPKPVSVPLVNGEFETSDLIATNDPDNNPVDWQYAVEFQFAGGASADPFNIELPEGSTVDLSTVTPVGSSAGVQIIRGPGIPEIEPGSDGQVLVLVDGEPAWGDAVGGVSSWNDLTDKPATFPPAAHSHTVANVTGLQSALDAKQPAGSYASAVHTHSASDLNAGTLSIARATPGTTIAIRETSPGAYPVRGSTRTDVTVFWYGTQPPTKGGNYMLDHDIWLKIATA